MAPRPILGSAGTKHDHQIGGAFGLRPLSPTHARVICSVRLHQCHSSHVHIEAVLKLVHVHICYCRARAYPRIGILQLRVARYY